MTIDCEVFTCDKYFEVIKQRIANGLESIGLEMVRISEIDEITYVSFDLKNGDIKKYKGYLQGRMDTTMIPKNTVYDIPKIKECVLETLEDLSTAR